MKAVLMMMIVLLSLCFVSCCYHRCFVNRSYTLPDKKLHPWLCRIPCTLAEPERGGSGGKRTEELTRLTTRGSVRAREAEEGLYALVAA